jgi:Diguanylate cyclase, GGDEF domain
VKRVPGFWPALLVAATVLYLTLSRAGADVVSLLASLYPVGAVLVGLRRYRSDPVPRYLRSAGWSWPPSRTWPGWWRTSGTGRRSAAGRTCSPRHLGILAASATVVIRRTPTDRGGPVQAGLIGIGLSGPVWELLIRPRLLTGEVSPAMQTTDLVVVMALMTVLGTLLRTASTTVLARAALGYLFVAVSCGAGRGGGLDRDLQRRHGLPSPLAEPVALAGGTAVVGASIGVAVTEPGREYTADSLIAEADRAMYAQKRRRVTGSRERSGGSVRSAAPAGRH